MRDFFEDAREGVFADIGASDWRDGSNTYVLEKDLGWTGLAVEAHLVMQTAGGSIAAENLLKR